MDDAVFARLHGPPQQRTLGAPHSGIVGRPGEGFRAVVALGRHFHLELIAADAAHAPHECRTLADLALVAQKHSFGRFGIGEGGVHRGHAAESFGVHADQPFDSDHGVSVFGVVADERAAVAGADAADAIHVPGLALGRGSRGWGACGRRAEMVRQERPGNDCRGDAQQRKPNDFAVHPEPPFWYRSIRQGWRPPLPLIYWRKRSDASRRQTRRPQTRGWTERTIRRAGPFRPGSLGGAPPRGFQW